MGEAAMGNAVMVFTRDLRVTDNPALTAAAADGEHVVPLFVFDDALLARCRDHANRLAFLLESLADLDSSLHDRGAALVVRRGDWVQTVIAAAREAHAETIHIADDYTGYAMARLARLEKAAAADGLAVHRHPGITVIPPGAISPPNGPAYQVFTPYYRRWLDVPRRPRAAAPKELTLPSHLRHGALPKLDELTDAERGAAVTATGGESAGRAALQQWILAHLADYDTGQNDLAADQTSRLSPYLHLGCLSPAAVAGHLSSQPGGDPFVRQIAWRDFFHQVLAVRPETAWREDYRSRGDRWHHDDAALAAWQAGQTGYPVVDAGMRQLAAEGFMHNRARMIVASFLTKDLYIDWRKGAAHFLRHLLDGDVACNQLNWQWVAGTGTDTNPHRIFNPTLQGKRFDPAGDYVRRYVPELAGLPASVIHEPDPATRRDCGYPEPLVDHREAIAAYRQRLR
ncbi:MAG: deoxyribodipyrimidine photo-lyase [Actinomycetota bacterium]